MFCTDPLPFKVISIGLDAALVSQLQLGEGFLELVWTEGSESPADHNLKVIQALESVAPQLLLEGGECPKVTRGKVWGVGGVRHESFSHSNFEEVICCLDGDMCWCIVLEEGESVGPEVGSSPPAGLPESSEDLDVPGGVDGQSLLDKIHVHNTLVIHEQDQHQFLVGSSTDRLGWTRGSRWCPLKIYHFCPWIIAENPGFICCDDGLQEARSRADLLQVPGHNLDTHIFLFLG